MTFSKIKAEKYVLALMNAFVCALIVFLLNRLIEHSLGWDMSVSKEDYLMCGAVFVTVLLVYPLFYNTVRHRTKSASITLGVLAGPLVGYAIALITALGQRNPSNPESMNLSVLDNVNDSFTFALISMPITVPVGVFVAYLNYLYFRAKTGRADA